jgi:hypothetical protein
MELRMLASSCRDSTCPTVYVDDDGSLVVQGYEVEGGKLPAGERQVRVPASLLIEAVAAYERSA